MSAEFHHLMMYPADERDAVLELWSGSNQFAEVSISADGHHNIEIFPSRNARSWNFSLEELSEFINETKLKIANLK